MYITPAGVGVCVCVWGGLWGGGVGGGDKILIVTKRFYYLNYTQ